MYHIGHFLLTGAIQSVFVRKQDMRLILQKKRDFGSRGIGFLMPDNAREPKTNYVSRNREGGLKYQNP